MGYLHELTSFGLMSVLGPGDTSRWLRCSLHWEHQGTGKKEKAPEQGFTSVSWIWKASLLLGKVQIQKDKMLL